MQRNLNFDYFDFVKFRVVMDITKPILDNC